MSDPLILNWGRRSWPWLPGLLIVFLISGCASQPARKQSVEKIEKTVVITTRYLVYLPDDYRENPEAKWPLLIFLHGSGERGEDIEQVRGSGFPKVIEAGKTFPFIAISPQCPAGNGWNIDILMDVLQTVQKDYRVDRDRVYLTGCSMGGYATWQWAAAYPELFAAIVPICGGGDPKTAYRLRSVPVWAFHGAKDNAVPLARSRDMVNAVKQSGGEAMLTVYPETGHNSWDLTYADPFLYTWLLEKKRKKIEIPAVKAYPPMIAVRAPADIKIDGELAEWSTASPLRLDTDDRSQLMRRIKLKWPAGKNSKSTYQGPKDCSAVIKMMWNEKGLYMAAEVTDDKVVCDRTGDPIWIGDCVDLGLSFRNEKDVVRPYISPADPNQVEQDYFTDKDFIFGFSPTGPNHTPEYHVYRNPLKKDQKADGEIQVVSRLTPDGYVLEVFISAKYLGCDDKMKSGSVFGFNCGVYDLDAKAIPEDFSLSEFPGAGGNPWSPDTFGKIELR